eukprot:scaffold11996_cov33-Phaeocystis_antarctica.AAC.1
MVGSSRWRARYAARRLVLVKVDLSKGTGGLTGHHHASPSHDRAAHTGGWRRPLLCSVSLMRRLTKAGRAPDGRKSCPQPMKTAVHP